MDKKNFLQDSGLIIGAILIGLLIIFGSGYLSDINKTGQAFSFPGNQEITELEINIYDELGQGIVDIVNDVTNHVICEGKRDKEICYIDNYEIEINIQGSHPNYEVTLVNDVTNHVICEGKLDKEICYLVPESHTIYNLLQGISTDSEGYRIVIPDNSSPSLISAIASLSSTLNFAGSATITESELSLLPSDQKNYLIHFTKNGAQYGLTEPQITIIETDSSLKLVMGSPDGGSFDETSAIDGINILANYQSNQFVLNTSCVRPDGSSCEVEPPELVSHYPFSGNSMDFVGTNDGTISGDVTLTTDMNGNVNSAYRFDGSNDFVQLQPFSVLETDKVTVSAWIKANAFDDSNGYNVILSQYDSVDNGYYLYVLNDKPTFYIGCDTYLSAESLEGINTNEWYNLVGTNDGSNLKIYVNGELKATKASEGCNGVNNLAYIGYDEVYNSGFNGVIDEVKIYNYALTQNDILNNYNSMLPNVTCTDSDGGKDYYAKGQIIGNMPPEFISEDMCLQDNPSYNLRETYCDIEDNNNDSYLGTSQLYNCTHGCNDGACIEVDENMTCTDSDGGLEYDVRGNTTGYYNNFETYGSIEDACCQNISGGNCGGHNGISEYNLVEMYCDELEIKEYHYNCPYGCSDGACVPFSGTDTTKITYSGDDTIMLEASLKDYDVQLDIAHDSDQDGDFDVVGSSPVKLIITETSSQFTFDQDTDEWFIATYKSGSVGETHVLEVSNIDDVDGITVKRYDGNVVAENKKVADTFDVGELIFVVNGYSETTMSVNLSGISVTNNLIITEEGLQIELPGGYMDNFDVTNLTITEGDSDGNIGVGERTEMFMWFNTDVEVTVGVVHQSFQEIEDTDVFEAFSTSARWLWDKSADQYDLEIEYPYGETTNETPEPQVSTTIDEIKTNSSAYKQVIGSTAVEDNIAAIDLAGFLGIDETIDDLTASINAYEIVIGGPCINRVAAELLGLPYPSCEAASTIPENKGIIKTFTNNGKKQILVAGWEALDTRIAAQAVVRYQEFYSEMNDSEVITFGSSLDDVNIGEEETSYTIRIEIGRDGLDNPIVTLVNDDTSYVICEDKTDREICYIGNYVIRIEIGRDGLDNPIVTLVNDDTSYVICEDKTDREICYLAPYQSPVCGNSITESGEECDDGNTVNGDGCSNDCIDESINGCQSVTFDEKTYYLDPCLLETTMIDGQGDKNFNIIIRQVGNASSYGFSTPGYGEGFPGYAIMGVSGGAYGDQTIPMYFNDGVLNANGSNPMFYTGYQPVNVYHGSATGWNQHELRFYIDLTVNPS